MCVIISSLTHSLTYSPPSPPSRLTSPQKRPVWFHISSLTCSLAYTLRFSSPQKRPVYGTKFYRRGQRIAKRLHKHRRRGAVEFHNVPAAAGWLVQIPFFSASISLVQIPFFLLTLIGPHIPPFRFTHIGPRFRFFLFTLIGPEIPFFGSCRLLPHTHRPSPTTWTTPSSPSRTSSSR